MRYVRYKKDGQARLGAMIDSDIVDIEAAWPDAPKTMRALIGAEADVHATLADRLAQPGAARRPLADCKLLTPMPDPGKIVCLGLNYADHAKEGGHAVPEYPALFLRASSSMIGPQDPMILPECSEQLDYEAELTIVIGRSGRHVSAAEAASVIFGYTAFNDGSVRHYQRLTAQWTAGKNFDGTGALGPCIVTADDLPDQASGLKIQTRLNGNVMQDSNTDQMIFGAFRTVEILSEIMTLEPGDLIAMGTPAGVGHARRPQVWMRDGDTVEVEIEGIGTIRNPVVAEKVTV
ncbi:2-keto-4-pentenoate hydratase/2-oxohepta-3-ene-1,7-dioic acid hydratase (catechol pathway) [Roseovarius mucosus DSM 17069]|uniref:2-keto-4-pentenoate hydratase/2-oxohepta-3-ene-1,7-dioic acid hydratase (Catechol pathway) n=1 Tax=Roseovarius mucosus DSM 17069 TaxID=1288298 RepID=A0A0A0HIC9_9RHOB|nr:fumarylacetoacetate hydrolase family protein [Roseovarius mucosus]KGM85913.1 2-keto-4-pentenoate hydratase/2-oxohepta-3-ene-1,7-dioic acid hydratase (catechol pathway) [Roseovarius mucosus DSM 17069]